MKKQRKIKQAFKGKKAENTFEILDLQQEKQSNEHIEANSFSQSIPLVIHLDDKFSVLMTKPGGWYKIYGINKIIYSSGEFKINDVLNQYNVNQNIGLLELSQIITEDKANIYSMIKSLGLRTDVVKPYDKLFYRYAPMIVEAQSLKVENSYPPWSNKIYNLLEEIKQSAEFVLLIVGNKNSGKSYFCDFAVDDLYQSGREVCLLDIDLGKGRGLPGTINLYIHSKDSDQVITYWVGQYTPMNYHQLYIESIKKIVSIYRSKFFNHALLVNTMGYLTGFGQIIMKQIYNIINPNQILFLSKQNDTSQFETLKSYLVSQQMQGITKNQTKLKQKSFKFITNPHATGKSNVESRSKKFEDELGFSSIQNFFQRKHKELVYNQISIQTQEGEFIRKQFNPFYTNLSLLIICDKQDYVFRFKSLGYGFRDKIFGLERGNICIKSEVGQFQKQFYDIGQKQLISLQETMECQSQFILPSYKGLGMMGYRNLTSKNIRF